MIFFQHFYRFPTFLLSHTVSVSVTKHVYIQHSSVLSCVCFDLNTRGLCMEPEITNVFMSSAGEFIINAAFTHVLLFFLRCLTFSVKLTDLQTDRTSPPETPPQSYCPTSSIYTLLYMKSVLCLCGTECCIRVCSHLALKCISTPEADSFKHRRQCT